MRLLLLVFISLFFSCNDRDIVEPIPTTYAFENVNYDGQSIRIDQLMELSSYLKQTNSLNGTSIQANVAKDMYADNIGLHFSNDRLNNTEKQLKNKVLVSEQQLFEQIIDSIAIYSTNFSNAFSGQAGISSSNDGQNHYLLNPHGVELTQIFEKGLMGACFYYQATSVYLGSGKMDVDNTVINEGIGTAMEHHWDECFGYLGVPRNFPNEDNPLFFWGKYAHTIDKTYPISQAIMNAFIEGRAAIGRNDLAKRDEMIELVRMHWETIVVGSAIHYLNLAQSTLNIDNAKAFHQLSEAFGFINTLKFGPLSNITNQEIDQILSQLYGSTDVFQADNYNVDQASIADAVDALILKFPFLEPVKTHL